MNIKKHIKKIIPISILEIRKKLKDTYPYRKYMDDNQCIFIHIPKTAGTSILKTLMGDQIRRDHAAYNEFLRADPEKFHKYYKFTIVRNPWDRMVSCYEYLLHGGNKNEDIYFHELFSSRYNTFDKFVLEYLDKDKIHEHGLFRPQYLYIYDYRGNCQVDYIGKFENLENDFKEITEKFNIPFSLPHVNRSQRKNYLTYYKNQDVVDKIFYLYSRDIELFNYEFVRNTYTMQEESR